MESKATDEMESKATEIVNKIDFEKITDHPNILIAAKFWDEDRYQAARICYQFMRFIDDMIDNRKKEEQALSCMEKKVFTDNVNAFIKCLKGNYSENPLIKDTIHIVETYKIPQVLFQNFARSMIHDIHHRGFRTFKGFLDYSEGASVAPASVFVHLCCLNKINGSFLAPAFDIVEVARPCALFSYLVHIIRDFQEDQINNLNYFPDDILERNNLVPRDLQEIAWGGLIPDSFRELIKEYCRYADYYRKKTLEQLVWLSSLVEARYLLSLQIIFELYLQVYERINIEDGTFTSEELNPKPFEVQQRVLDVIHHRHL